MIKETLNNQGLIIEATYSQKELEETFYPLLEKFTQIRRDKGSRVIIYLAAPPGAGKTTLALLLEKLYKQKQMPFTLQAAAMDGFHHKNDYLTSHYTTLNGRRTLLKDVKGKPETFDLKGLKQSIKALLSGQAVKWPVYSRRLHDVAEEMQTIDADIILLEGNYLLLNQKGWEDLAAYADFTLMLSAPADLLKKRLIDRKLKGGSAPAEAAAHYKRVDQLNDHLVRNEFMEADWVLELNAAEEWVIR